MKLNSEQHIEPDISKLSNSYLKSVYLLSSDKPIAVIHLGDADFSIPSLSQFGNDYWFYIPEEDKNDPMDKYVTVIVKQDEAGGLVFKGPLVPVFEFKKTVEFDGVEYLVASMEVLWSGFHRISHVSSAARFGGFVSGTSRYAGPIRFGYPFGLVLDTDKPGCQNTVSPEPLGRTSSGQEKKRASKICVAIFITCVLFLTPYRTVYDC